MKIRSGFVSNSSSSSFIAELDKRGGFDGEGYGSVTATTGLGFIAKMEMDDDDYDNEDSDDTFVLVHDHEGDGDSAFIRPLGQMRGDQTLDQFMVETTKLFQEKFGEKTKKVKGPMFLVGGSLGNE